MADTRLKQKPRRKAKLRRHLEFVNSGRCKCVLCGWTVRHPETKRRVLLERARLIDT